VSAAETTGPGKASVATVAIVGGGVIGAGWIGRYLHRGADVRVFDPDPEAERKINDVLANAESAFEMLYGVAPVKGALSYHSALADAVAGAEIVHESVPERLDLKQRVHADITAAAGGDTIVCTSTSGLLPTKIQEGLALPGNLIVAHPFNPVYLLPLVELVAGQQTAAGIVDRAATIFDSVGMKPLKVREEIDAFIADRLLRRRHPLWLWPALGANGAVPDLSHGGRRSRHAGLYRDVQAVLALAVDQADGRA